jgi:hypothetical protein
MGFELSVEGVLRYFGCKVGVEARKSLARCQVFKEFAVG